MRKERPARCKAPAAISCRVRNSPGEQLRIDATYTSRHATYDLRRLRRKGLIVKIPKSHRYQLTEDGRRVEVLFTKAFNRVLALGLSLLDPNLPSELLPRSPLATAWRKLEQTLERFADDALTAA